ERWLGHAVAPEQVAERLTEEELEHEVRRSVGRLPHVERLDDAGVADERGRARFAQEPFARHSVALLIAVQDLDGDSAPRVGVFPGVHARQAALADQAAHLVPPAEESAGLLALGVLDADGARQARERRAVPRASRQIWLVVSAKAPRAEHGAAFTA